MPAFTAMQMLAFEAPKLAGSSITKNEVTMTVTQFFQALLDSNGGVVELALANLFRIVALEDRNSSLTLGEFSFTRRTGMTYDERRFYWEQKYRAKTFGEQGCAPTIGYVFNAGLPGPAVR